LNTTLVSIKTNTCTSSQGLLLLRDPPSKEFSPSRDPHLKSYNSLSEDPGTGYCVVLAALSISFPIPLTILFDNERATADGYVENGDGRWVKKTKCAYTDRHKKPNVMRRGVVFPSIAFGGPLSWTAG
jgi:hypothetical protein